ncbi:AraC family transcriptional regulator [Parahaliea mediterranea]|uniref:AraC family transcriptional regulator n=1 Tax=Parahaliea mediterranea TaxID=651086 RepID=A0A939IKY5_9GAMM|nr:AraC family transcriptional regulator [Parahaliea mediterranea]MBN7797821.1 AraC family transcriptional regulator [Parahaliea mediterranea]
MFSTQTKLMLYFRRIHEAMVLLGIDPGDLYRQLNIRIGSLEDDNSGIAVARYLELLNLASDKFQRPYLGLEIALVREVADFGVLGYIMRNASSVRQCFQMVEKYMDIVSPGARSSISQVGEHYMLTYQVEGYSPQACRHEVEMSLCQVVRLVQELTQQEWYPEEVYFQHAGLADITPLSEAFRARIRFDHFCNGVLVPEDILNAPVSNADPQLLSILEQQVAKSLQGFQQSTGFLSNVTFLISSYIGTESCCSESIARQLGISRRSLHRRLAEHGSSLTRLRETVMVQVAKESLSATNVSITELAQRLGYSDSSAFNRAFKRLAGASPTRYRARHR